MAQVLRPLRNERFRSSPQESEVGFETALAPLCLRTFLFPFVPRPFLKTEPSLNADRSRSAQIETVAAQVPTLDDLSRSAPKNKALSEVKYRFECRRPPKRAATRCRGMDARRVLGEIAWLQKRLCDALMPFAENRHFKISLDQHCSLIVVQRKPTPFLSSTDLVSSFEQMGRSLDALTREELYFLGDTRLGPARNDPKYEDDMKRVRHKLLGGYGRAATVTKTIVGQMQVRRHAQQDGRELLVTSDLGEAFAYLKLPRHVLPPLT